MGPLIPTSQVARLMAAALCMVGPACASGPEKQIAGISTLPEAPAHVQAPPPIDSPHAQAKVEAQVAPAITAQVAETPVELEYVRLDGQSCLQPKVISGVPDDSDFIAAEKRWLGARPSNGPDKDRHRRVKA